MPHFRTALHGYKDPVMKADAAHALGIIFSDYLNLPDSAYFYLQAAHTLIPYDFGYATNLRGRSQGRGQFSMQPSHYTEVPKNIAEKIISGGRF